MKTFALIFTLLFTLGNQAMSCDHHAQMKAQETQSLPGDSLYQLPSKWTDQTGRRASLGDLAGKPRLVAMVFTRCQASCPLLVHDLKTLEESLSPAIRENLGVDLFSFDSEKETEKTATAFLKLHRAENARWTLHFSDAGSVAELAAALGVQYKKLSSGDFIHANLVFLLGPNGEVLAKKEGLREDATFIAAVKKALEK